jgi:hypothetical protein
VGTRPPRTLQRSLSRQLLGWVRYCRRVLGRLRDERRGDDMWPSDTWPTDRIDPDGALRPPTGPADLLRRHRAGVAARAGQALGALADHHRNQVTLVAGLVDELAAAFYGLPLQQTCPHPNACLTCDSFLTTVEFMPQHHDQLARTEQLIAQAEADGRRRLVEMNEPVRLNLLRIIDGIEALEASDGC